MVWTSFVDLAHGFEIALQPHNLLYCFIGVLIGNLVGVLPGMGVLSAVSILLPLTFGMQPVAAILMISGIFYGAQYGGAICSILLNLPSHPPHAVTCLDGYPLTRQGRGGVALGITMMGAVFGAAFGIIQMMFLAPYIAKIAFSFGAAEICALMLLGLLAGSTLSKGSPIKGVAMTALGMLLGLVGTDTATSVERYTFGRYELADGVELVALALGLFGIAEFLRSVNNVAPVDTTYAKLRLRDMRPTKAEVREAAMPVLRGTIVGSLCSLIPGTGPVIASFIAYATEKKISRTPEKFGHGALAGVAAPEASTHSSIQGDFIPTMSLGIPGDAAMALLLGALVIHNVTPGPRLIVEHPDVFWGLIASFWIGNIILVFLNLPLIGMWVRLLTVPYRLLYPSALFFICIGVFATRNSLFDVGITLALGIFGYLLLLLRFEPAPMLLGFVLGPRFEDNFRRALDIAHGDLAVFVEHPISAFFLGVCCLLIGAQIFARIRKARAPIRLASTAFE
ncbi:MAG: tripartite tricarboxylate transporter permease [Hyphomicrobiales bacterium]|nr:tripartite tricarboxylate transporter permease [Hyphomicrobiales bacterium]